MAQMIIQPFKKEYVILVNDQDKEAGIEEKLEAHRKGKLHRAFSIIVYDSLGRMLIQQRSGTKYHSPNLWTETCCGHPRPKETIEQAAHRRLNEEMGFDCVLNPLFDILYNSKMDNGLIENEYDHVLTGISDIKPQPNKKEVSNYRLIELDELKTDIARDPKAYATWFRILVDEMSNKGLERRVQ
jgi:isopentenyl-diphosphate Delta-isomerase